MYCKKCGGKVESYASHCPFCGEAMSGNDVTATYTKSVGAEGAANKSIGGWILTYIIMGIPLVGFIMMFVWAFGEKTKADPTFRNWARTALLLTAISVVLSVVCVLIVLPALEGMLPEIPA
jgi:uncharacterized membrane protein YvbJ